MIDDVGERIAEVARRVCPADNMRTADWWEWASRKADDEAEREEADNGRP